MSPSTGSIAAWSTAWTGRDQFFEPIEPSLTAYLLSLPSGLAENGRHPLRYFIQWARQVTWAGVRRQLGLDRKS